MVLVPLRRAAIAQLTRDQFIGIYRASPLHIHERFAALFAPDVVVHLPGLVGVVPFAGVHRGRESALRVIRDAISEFEILDGAIHDVIADDTHAMVRRDMTLKAIKTCTTARLEIVDAFTHADGVVTRFDQFFDTATLAAIAGWGATRS